MKKLEKAIYGIMLFCLAGSAVLIALSPDTVPVHYNFAGEVDRYGSRYEALLFPLGTAAMGAFFLLYARFFRKRGQTLGEKILLYTGLCMTVYFSALGFFFIWKAMTYDPIIPPAVSMDAMKTFLGVAVGILLVALGNVMPKAQRNAVFGLRTKWSLSSDSVWQKSQRFGGISGVVCGLVTIVLSTLVPGEWGLLTIPALVAAWAILCAVASYHYYKEENHQP